VNEKYKPKTRKVTLIDVKLAPLYYLFLREFAKQKKRITYGSLVEQVRALHADDPVIKSAIATNVGRRLEVVRLFTNDHNYPDLTSLVVNQHTEDCGDEYLEEFDSTKARQDVFEYDWSAATTELNGFMTYQGRKIIVKPKPKAKPKPAKIRITKEDARNLMYAFFKTNSTSLPSNITDKRDLIVKLLMDGIPVEDAFSQAISQLK